MSGVVECEVPETNALFASMASSSFRDCHAVDLPRDGRSAMRLYLDVVSRTPGWIDAAMRARNRVVGMFGLKNLGALSEVDLARSESSYAVGQRVGIFTLIEQREDEVVLGDSDRHLDVKVSVLKSVEGERMRVAVSTVVHVRNALGSAYMVFVGPAHRRIAPAMVARLLDAPPPKRA